MRRLRAGEALAGVAGVVLIATLWSAPPVLAVLLCLTALPAVALPVAQVTRRSPALPVALGVFTTAAGTLATALALVRLLDRPGAGAWVGLAASLGVLAGAWLSLRAESLPGAQPPHVPRRPAPPSAS
jgi:hypothetical protein